MNTDTAKPAIATFVRISDVRTGESYVAAYPSECNDDTDRLAYNLCVERHEAIQLGSVCARSAGISTAVATMNKPITIQSGPFLGTEVLLPRRQKGRVVAMARLDGKKVSVWLAEALEAHSHVAQRDLEAQREDEA